MVEYTVTAGRVSLGRFRSKSEGIENDPEGRTTEQENRIFKMKKMTDSESAPMLSESD